eukprot:TRINITY_DN38089_c0_g1_i1.p1 TRINITY_DN38089_c0_g1~~TRINITY_DN38089_c0_g1_i1.p1  ORF type:complete len:797 (+),score=128.77 TRINITY_DN38089_c0_g1_i1:128-2518(+)
MNLTTGSIPAIYDGNCELKPVLQVLDVKQIVSSQISKERFRMILSDGQNALQAMIAVQLNERVKSGEIQNGSVVRLQEYTCNNVQNRKIIIVLNMDVLRSKAEILGEAKIYTGANSEPSQHQQQRTHMAQESTPSGQNRPLARSLGSSEPQKQAQPQFQTHVQHHNASSVDARQNGGPLPRTTVQHVAEAKQGWNSNPSQPSSSVQTSVSVGGRPSAYMYGGSTAPSQPPPRYSNRGPISVNEAPARIIPIAALNPYQGRWTIKARVTGKGELRRFNNARGDGKVFSFDLLDSDGGEIRATCFNAAVDQFYDRIEQGKVYIISKGTLKPAQKNFNHLNNEWEIYLDSSSAVELCSQDSSIPNQRFSFKPISEVENMENNSTIDVIGVVTSVSQSAVILRKNGMETQKRTLQLKDKSGCSVELTMWGGFCNNEGEKLQELFDAGANPILAVKAGRISDFSGKSVGTISSTQLFINPDLPDAHSLKAWFEREGKDIASQSITKEAPKTEIRKTVSQIKDEGLGKSDKPDWILVRATLSFIKVDNFCYTACPLWRGDRQCNKKVSNYDGTWHCDACGQSFPECNYRYLLQAQVQDATGVTWVTAFQEAAEEIMGITAKELYNLRLEDDDVKFAEIMRNIVFNQYLFKLKVKEETYGDDQRVKCTVVKAERLDYSSECRVLLDLISKISWAGNNTVTESMVKPGISSNSQNLVNQSLAYHGGGSISNTHDLSASTAYQRAPHSGSAGRTDNLSTVTHTSEVLCQKCRQYGHWAKDCASLHYIPPANGSGVTGERSGAWRF